MKQHIQNVIFSYLDNEQNALDKENRLVWSEDHELWKQMSTKSQNKN